MSNEELLKFAEESGLHVCLESRLLKFAALVQRATAEDCAKVCEGMPDREYNYPLTREEEGVERGWETGRMNCATAIRTKYQEKKA